MDTMTIRSTRYHKRWSIISGYDWNDEAVKGLASLVEAVAMDGYLGRVQAAAAGVGTR
jgi:hypothetical protein